jgi:hypothetical protein
VLKAPTVGEGGYPCFQREWIPDYYLGNDDQMRHKWNISQPHNYNDSKWARQFDLKKKPNSATLVLSLNNIVRRIKLLEKMSDLFLNNWSQSMSWTLSLLGIFLILSPLIIGKWVLNKYSYKFKSMITGLILGLISLPLSLWLSLHYNLDGVRVIIGVLGAIILVFHQLPFAIIGLAIPSVYKLDDFFGFIIWAPVYGLIGLAFDFKRIKKSSNTTIL